MRHRQTAIGIALLGLFALAACESGGDGQARSGTPQSRSASANAPEDEEANNNASDRSDREAELIQHPEPKPDREKIDPGDVPPVGSKLELSEKEWRERLTKKEFKILRKWGTEPAHSGDLLDVRERGIYYCAGCGAPVFSSKHKFKSKSGWPSFTRPYDPKRVGRRADDSLGMTRTEIHCTHCGGHLGHVFDDGPAPTGLRYCINSLALDFKSVDEIQSESESEPKAAADEANESPESTN